MTYPGKIHGDRQCERIEEGMREQDVSLIAAIEGDFYRMSRSDLAETVKMITRGRELWRKEAEEAQAQLTTQSTRIREPSLRHNAARLF